MEQQVTIKPGQRFADTHSRSNGRVIEVLEVSEAGDKARCRNLATGKVTLVTASRLTERKDYKPVVPDSGGTQKH
jgi:hypothetical protein